MKSITSPYDRVFSPFSFLLGCIWLFLQNVLWWKILNRSRQTVLGHPFFGDEFPWHKKRLVSKLVKLHLLYSTVTCCLYSGTCALILDKLFCEVVLFSPQSQSPDLWVLPSLCITRFFFYHHYCFCSISYNTV